MGENFISSLHIQKLGHKIQEIRLRALYNILSKLDNGVVYDNQLARNMELLRKLFEWFKFEECVEEKKVLSLLDRILKSETGLSLIKYAGSKSIIQELQIIKSKIAVDLYASVDSMVERVQSAEENFNIVPPLISELPLSYRSEQSEGTNKTQKYTSVRSEYVNNIKYQNSNQRDSVENSKRTVTFEPAYTDRNFSTRYKQDLSPVQPEINATVKSTISTPNTTQKYVCFPYIILEWQSLVTADYHVLKSVEDTLQKPPQLSAVLHSCDFFCNVMLQDFPAEVFLQRPTIILLFHKFLNTCNSTRIINAILTCLKKLTENLLTRIHYYSDLSTRSFKKQNIQINNENDEPLSEKQQNLGYKLSNSEEIANDSATDTQILQTRQLSLQIYCLETLHYVLSYISEKRLSLQDNSDKKKVQASMNTALQLTDKLLSLLIVCIEPTIWQMEEDEYISNIITKLSGILTKLGEILEQFRLMVAATDMEYFERMAQLHLLNSTSVLLKGIIPIKNSDNLLPRNLKNALSSSLLDASFGRMFPATHESLVQYVSEFGGRHETESFLRYREVKEVCSAITAAVTFIKHNSFVSIMDSLQVFKKSLPSLEFHKNCNVIKIFLNLCLKNLSTNSVEENLQEIINEILLTLLSHDDEKIRKEMYLQMQILIKNSLGINHVKNIGDSSQPGLDVLFFIQPDVITEITAYGLSSDCFEIQTRAEDILIHILKCKFLVSELIWKKLINAIIPAFPILHCHADKKTPLGNSILKIMDPDICPSIFIPEIDVIKGNLRFLFNKESSIRNEAVSRLCWLLTTEKDYDSKIPKIKTLDNCGLSNIFIINQKMDLTKSRNSHQFYQISSLHQVLELLSSTDVEPAIRRSALTQISVMMGDHFMHTSFLDRNGLQIILKILHNSLIESEHHIYPDSAVSCVSILKNICLHNNVVRQELSVNIDLYFCLLRVFILYSTDKCIQQDGSLLLCLLLFSEYIINNFSSRDNTGISLPDVIVKLLNIPFKCNSHWKTSHHMKPKLASILMSDDWCKSTLRMHWNIEWYGGINEIINWTQASSETNEKQTEFNSELQLTNQDLTALKATSILYCCQKYLYDIQNAVTHLDVLASIRGLAGYIVLWILASDERQSADKLLSLPWHESFSRFLTAPPANSDDQSLLIELLQLLSILLKLYKRSDITCWIKQILLDPTHYLAKLLQTEVHTDNRSVSLELLTLISECSILNQEYLGDQLLPVGSHDAEQKANLQKPCWIYIIKIITENLKFNDSGQFYNLAYLDKLLSCLVQITANMGWSEERHPGVDVTKLLSEIIEGLSVLLIAFHHGKGSDATSSCMGLSITRNTLLIMNHVLCEMQHSYKKNWEPYWICDTVCNATFLSLCSLWLCRDVIVRAATLQLVSGLALSPRGATIIVENICQQGEGVWENVLSILTDHTEANTVRENAALLLMNLCSHTNVSSNGQVILPLCHAPLSSDKNVSSNESVLILLKENNFFEELNNLLSSLHLECTFEIIPLKHQTENTCAGPLSSQSHQFHQSTTNDNASSCIENEINTVTTPRLVRSTAMLLNNLMHLAPEQITSNLYEHGLIRSYFRCLTSPPLNVKNNRSLLFYCDVLDMCCTVCTLLTKSVLINSSCCSMILNTRDCLHVLISLLNPELFDTHIQYFVHLRNKLWCEIFQLISALLNIKKSTDSKDIFEFDENSYNIVSSLLLDSGYNHFMKAVCISIDTKITGLQNNALKFLIALLSPAHQSTIATDSCNRKNSSQSIITLFDTNKPASFYHDDIENTDPLDPYHHHKTDALSLESKSLNSFKSEILVENNQNILSHREDTLKKKNLAKKLNSNRMISKKYSDSSTTSVGSILCKSLIQLYETHNWENNKDTKKKTVVIGAISSLLNISNEAKKCALEEDLLSNVILNLKNLNLQLSLHSLDSLRRTTDKKKICPILKEVDILIGMVTNFMLRNDFVKTAACKSGLADLTHKFWLWCTVDRDLLTNALKMLCTFTTECEEGCQSILLTNPAAGTGPRKTPSGISLLHAVINLICKEMDHVSRARDITVLQLSFHFLKNICAVSECRNVLAKQSHLFQSFNRTHPNITKHQKPWETIEKLLLELLQTFTFYPEGQLCITKSFEHIELLITLATNSKSVNKLIAMSVLRNIAFHQSNRVILLSSVEFIQFLHTKISNGSTEEKNIVVTIIWALVANNQRSKIIIKCAGLDSCMQDVIKKCEIQGIDDKSYHSMLYVLGMLKDGAK